MPAAVTAITKGSRRKPRIVEVPAEKLKIDQQVQRRLIPARVKALADKLDLDGLGILTVSERANGDLVVLDGQHRVAALLQHDMGEWEVTCHVYRGLTLAQEAAFFRRHNNQRPITPYDDFSKGLVEGDEVCCEVNAIVEGHGLHVAGAGRDGAITCVKKLLQLYAGSNGTPDGALLDATLDLAVATWGLRYAAFEKNVLGGVAIVLGTYGDEVDRAKLIEKLAKFPGGASGLLGKARMLKEIRSTSVERLVAAVIVEVYNRSRRGGKLASL